jgi:hypothetical protein
MLPVAVAKIPPPSPAPAPHLLPGDDSNDVSSLLQATTAAVEAADAVTGSELDWLYVDVDRWAGVPSISITDAMAASDSLSSAHEEKKFKPIRNITTVRAPADDTDAQRQAVPASPTDDALANCSSALDATTTADGAPNRKPHKKTKLMTNFPYKTLYIRAQADYMTDPGVHATAATKLRRGKPKTNARFQAEYGRDVHPRNLRRHVKRSRRQPLFLGSALYLEVAKCLRDTGDAQTAWKVTQRPTGKRVSLLKEHPVLDLARRHNEIVVANGAEGERWDQKMRDAAWATAKEACEAAAPKKKRSE